MNRPIPFTGSTQQPAVLLLPIRLGLLAAAFLFCCLPALDLLIRSWAQQDRYGFRFLALFLAALWLRHDWSSLRRLVVRPVRGGGAALLMTGALMLLLGRLGADSLLQQVGVLVVITALVLLLLGLQFLLRLALPLVFLALMAPVLDPLIVQAHPPFQLFVAAASGQLLDLMGVPLRRAPQLALEAAGAYTGFRYAVSILLVSVPLLFITQRTWQRRLLLLLLALAIGIASEPLRLTVIGLWTHYVGGHVHGPLHLFHGYAVYLAGLAVLFSTAWLLQRDPEHGPGRTEQARQDSAEQGGLREFHPFNQAWFLAFSIFVGMGLALQVCATPQMPQKTGLPMLPGELIGCRLCQSGQQAPKTNPLNATTASLRGSEQRGAS